MLVKFITYSPVETKQLGGKLGRFCRQGLSSQSRALVISLEGDLGGGKTTFLQGFARAFQIKKILSPTFVIYRGYPLTVGPFQKFYHFDFYRLEKALHIQELGWEEKLADPRNILAVEWGSKFPSLLPTMKIQVEFVFRQLNEREIFFHFPPSWSSKWSMSL